MTASDQDHREQVSHEGTDRDPVELGPGTPLAEWVMAALGALIAVAVIAQLVVSGLARDDRPPEFRLEVVEVAAVGSSYLARIDVRNVGGTAAAGVQVKGRLSRDGASSQDAHAQLEHLPAGATRTVGMLFDDDPSSGSLTTAVVGFRLP